MEQGPSNQFYIEWAGVVNEKLVVIRSDGATFRYDSVTDTNGYVERVWNRVAELPLTDHER
jgi:hypothetical protein